MTSQTLDNAKPQTLDTSISPASSSLTRNVSLAVLLVITAIVLGVRYASRPLTNPQPLAANPQSLSLPATPSIVILPFTNLSGDPSQEYFNDGLTAEITNTLSRVASLFVIARTSAFTYKGKAVKVQDISRELGVRYVLEGSARKTTDQLRVLVQLIDGTTGGQVWSESYERPVTDIFAIQDEIAQKIGTTLKLQFPLWEFGLPIRKRTSNMEAYDYFLRGLDYCCRFTKEANAQARQLLERAIELDPQYAEAYAVLGTTYFAEWVYQWNPDPQNREQALALAQKSIALNDSLTWAHRLLSAVYLYKRQYEESIAEAERAIALGPNEADNYGALTESFVLAGQPERAIAYGEQALCLNPRAISFAYFSLGWAYRLVGRYEEAIAILKKFLGQYPKQLGARLNLAIAYQESGREEEARAEVAQVLRLNPNYSLETLRKMNLQKDPVSAERSYAALRKAGLK